jgi:hypothetical protein
MTYPMTPAEVARVVSSHSSTIWFGTMVDPVNGRVYRSADPIGQGRFPAPCRHAYVVAAQTADVADFLRYDLGLRNSTTWMTPRDLVWHNGTISPVY